MTEQRVVLDVSMNTAEVLARACEFFMRMKMGQVDEYRWELMMHPHSRNKGDKDWESIDEYLKLLKEVAFPGLPQNASYGVGGDKETDMMYEVYRTIQYTLAWHEHPDGGIGVCYDKPMSYSGEKMPKCSVEKRIIQNSDGILEGQMHIDDILNERKEV